MMRVLFITRKWPPAIGGMETYSVELTSELSRLCHLSIRRLPGRADGRPPSIFALARFTFLSMVAIAVGRRVDVIHVGDLVLWPLTVVARLFQPSASAVITAHGLDVVYGTRKGILPVMYRLYLALGVRFCSKKARVIAISHYTAESCHAIGLRDTVIVPHGVYAPSRDAGGVGETEPYVLFVGRLVRRKGARWFVENVLPLVDSQIRFMVVGMQCHESELEAICTSRRVEYRGVVSDEELHRLRRAALAVVMPNIPTAGKDFEGFGLAAPEAAADGGVLLASRIEGIVDAVVDGETGFLLPALDGPAWATKISEISRWTSEARNAFIRRAKEVIVTRYSWAQVAHDTFASYQRSVNRVQHS